MATYKKNQFKAQLVQNGPKGIQSRHNWIKQQLFNFQEEQIMLNKFQRTNYTLHYNYKIIIYSHISHEPTTSLIKQQSYFYRKSS